MAGSDTEDVEFDAVPVVALGAPGAYLDRVGFWYGAIEVARMSGPPLRPT